MAFCFVDLTGFTRYTEEEGDEEALDLVERFVETVEATLPAEATIVKTIGDEVMIVSPDPVTLTEWAVGFLTLFQRAAAAAGRDPLRARRLPRRRLLRHRGQPHPPGRRPGAGRRGAGHRRAVVDAIGELGLPRVRADRRGRAEGLPGAGRSCSSSRAREPDDDVARRVDSRAGIRPRAAYHPRVNATQGEQGALARARRRGRAPAA